MTCLLCNKKLTKTLTNTLRDNTKTNVLYCEKCDLAILENKHSKKWLQAFYKSQYRKSTNPQLLFDTYSSFQQDRIELIKPYLNKNIRLLEIGCSAGMFLYHVKDYVKEIVGIDYDINSIRYVTDKCNCVTATNINSLKKINNKKFDIICAFQTLEHILNPIKFLQEIKTLLKPNGIIYIEVPNLYDSLRYVYNLPNHSKFWFHSAHLYYFSKQSLLLLMSRLGLKGNIYFTQDYNIFNHIHWIDTDAPDKDCLRGLDNIKLPFNNNVDNNIKETLTNTFNLFDKCYKEKLKELEISSNISFIGERYEM